MYDREQERVFNINSREVFMNKQLAEQRGRGRMLDKIQVSSLPVPMPQSYSAESSFCLDYYISTHYQVSIDIPIYTKYSQVSDWIMIHVLGEIVRHGDFNVSGIFMNCVSFRFERHHRMATEFYLSRVCWDIIKYVFISI